MKKLVGILVLGAALTASLFGQTASLAWNGLGPDGCGHTQSRRYR